MKKLLGALTCLAILLFAGKSGFSRVVERYCRKQPVITIFVHGSRPQIKCLVAKKFKAKPGLLPVKEYEETSHYAQVATILEQRSPEKYCKEHFYVFGWSGSVSFNVRKKMAKKLCSKVRKLLDAYKKDCGIYPKVQVITFSHGGNIALQLSDFLPFFDSQTIDLDLVLIGCPVQAATECMINCPHFSHITVISSKGDVIQRMDPHNLYGPRRDKKTRVFSRRFFDVDTLEPAVKSKITQCAITVNRKVLGHLDLGRSFMKHVPEVLDQSSKAVPGEILGVNICDPEFVFCRFYNIF
jgi:hypothetical protein